MESATLGRIKVAKRKPAGDKPKRDDVAIKMDRIVAEKAKFIAKRRGVTLAEFVTESMRPIVDREFPKAMKELGGGA